MQTQGTREVLWLAEYQAVHFGLTTALKAKFHYRRGENGDRTELPGSLPVEVAMAAAVQRVWPATSTESLAP